MNEESLSERDKEDLQAGGWLRQLETDLVGTAHLACLMLIGNAVRLNAGKSEYTEGNVVIKGKPEGSWKITVEQTDDDQTDEAE